MRSNRATNTLSHEWKLLVMNSNVWWEVETGVEVELEVGRAGDREVRSIQSAHPNNGHSDL